MGDEPKQDNGTTATKPRKRAAKKQPPALDVPDVIGDQGRAGVAADLFMDVQTQIARLEAMMIANDQSESDPCGLSDAKGDPISYGERLKVLRATEARLTEFYAPLLPEIKKLIEKLRAQQQAG